MTVKTEAFLALEASLSKRLHTSLRGVLQPIYAKVADALAAGDYPTAERLVQNIQTDEVFTRNQPFITYMTNLAMLFGASRVTNTPGTSVVGLGFEKNTTYQLVQSFQQMVAQKAEGYLRNLGMKLVVAHRDQPVLKADSPRVLRDFASFMDANGKAFFDMASSLHTSRVSAYGFTAEAMALGIEEYQINEQLDKHICPVCQTMHGKTFKVKDARLLLDIVTRAVDPDDLKSLQPWPKQDKDSVESLRGMSAPDIVSRGWHTPPFHPRCRGLLVRVGKSPALGQIISGRNPDPYAANTEDFAHLNIKADAKLVAAWNAMIGIPPTQVASVLAGQSIEDLLTGLSEGTKSPLKSVQAYTGFIEIKAEGLPVGLKMLPQTVRFYDDKLLLTKVGHLSEADTALYLRRLYLLAQDAELQVLEVAVDLPGLEALGFTEVAGIWALDLTNTQSMKQFLE